VQSVETRNFFCNFLTTEVAAGKI